MTDLTIAGMLDELRARGAAVATVVYRDCDDAALGAVIVVDGRDETDEIVAAVEAIQESWE